MDGYTFILEGATKNKYQCIMSNMYYDGPSKFRRVFDEIVKYTRTDSLIDWGAYDGPSKKADVKDILPTELKQEKEPPPKTKRKKA